MVLRVQGVRLRSRRCLGSIREIKLNEMLIEVCYLESRIFFFFSTGDLALDVLELLLTV